ncbi:MC119 [Molluscum contagiosum virus subtype 2]|uniref:MC119L n=4 Tax=Molluscum contagiosum virus TaxID=10279 RepID=A0A7G5AXC0_MCV1|nr:MC119L [Molluscum contagiosum virus subtype 1]AQY16692.1 MC119 [Molluscum contagiosum virus subtype 2]AZT86356.1 MC119L [Molluscum contagiosum virus]AAC55247.1 MC119L [Molluscum contagiosum virus subtype 1]AQY16868.1 MC119 [Molluscum contagiosum virus subtype 1]AQY17047.1 MC119 [Molluscum contagiosum virus subtype 1]
MITSYEPLLLLCCVGASLAANRLLSRASKLDAVFSVHAVFFLWFLFHFLYSVF